MSFGCSGICWLLLGMTVIVGSMKGGRCDMYAAEPFQCHRRRNAEVVKI